DRARARAALCRRGRLRAHREPRARRGPDRRRRRPGPRRRARRALRLRRHRPAPDRHPDGLRGAHRRRRPAAGAPPSGNAGAVDGGVKAWRAILETLAASAYLDTGDLRAFYRLCAKTIEGRPNAYIVLFDGSGQPLLNSSRPFGSWLPNPLLATRPAGTDPRYPDVPVGGAEPVKRVLETVRPVVSDLFVSLVTGQPRISLDVPIVQNGRVRY